MRGVDGWRHAARSCQLHPPTLTPCTCGLDALRAALASGPVVIDDGSVSGERGRVLAVEAVEAMVDGHAEWLYRLVPLPSATEGEG